MINIDINRLSERIVAEKSAIKEIKISSYNFQILIKMKTIDFLLWNIPSKKEMHAYSCDVCLGTCTKILEKVKYSE